MPTDLAPFYKLLDLIVLQPTEEDASVVEAWKRLD
jgi:hypothetical protein